ncbi:uncharacterized protein LOC134855483 isoform X2 [Symsagittifera roscoffensis]
MNPSKSQPIKSARFSSTTAVVPSPLSTAVVMLLSLQMMFILQGGSDASPYNLANYRNSGKRSSLPSNQLSTLSFPITEDIPEWYDLMDLPSISDGEFENTHLFESSQPQQSSNSGLVYFPPTLLENNKRERLQGLSKILESFEHQMTRSSSKSSGPSNKRSGVSCMWKSSCSNFDTPLGPLNQ